MHRHKKTEAFMLVSHHKLILQFCAMIKAILEDMFIGNTKENAVFKGPSPLNVFKAYKHLAFIL